MERFVFVAAIVIAVLFGLGAMFGPHLHFEIDGDEGGTSPVVAVAPGRMEAQAFSGGALRIRHAAAIVAITPEDRTDYLIEIDNSAGRAPMPTVAVDDNGRVLIDGQLRGRVSRCDEAGGASLRGYGDMTAAELPRITIRAPRALSLDRGGAGTTEIGALQSLDLDLSGCSSVSAGDITDTAALDVAGSGHVRTGAARHLSADVAGSGEVSVGAVAEGADVDIAGSGSVTIASLNGDLSADGAGSGNVAVQGGAIGAADIDLAGSGDIEIAAPVQRLKVSIVGSGDVDIQGEVGDIEAEIAGSGSVTARAVTGTIRKEVWGSGDVRVGG